MFSHVVIFWTDPGQPNAAEELIAGATKYLQPIPGIRFFHIGKMVGSQRPVVDQTYQVALNTVRCVCNSGSSARLLVCVNAAATRLPVVRSR